MSVYLRLPRSTNHIKYLRKFAISGTIYVYEDLKFSMNEALRQFKAEIFQALAHPTRIAILEVVREKETPVSVILEQVGLEPANASQHFAVLRAKHILVSRKEGNQVFYSVRDPLILDVLDTMRRYFQSHLMESLELLKQDDSDAAHGAEK